MQVKVTRPFRMVRPGDVWPTPVAAGEIVDGRIAEVALGRKCGERVTVKVAAAAQAKAVEPTPAPPPAVRAKLTRKHVHNDESYARGLIVEGDLARLFVEQGVAELMSPADKAADVPATK